MALGLIDEIKGTSNRASIFYEQNSLNKVYFEGSIIWEKDIKAYTVDSVTINSIVKRTGGSGDRWQNDAYESRMSGPTYTNTYVSAKSEVWSKWVGAYCYAKCSYTGVIDLTKLPEYTEIKKLVVKKHSGGSSTYTYDQLQGKTTLEVSDYKYTKDEIHCADPHYPAYTSATATAGIAAIQYYYAI